MQIVNTLVDDTGEAMTVKLDGIADHFFMSTIFVDESPWDGGGIFVMPDTYEYFETCLMLDVDGVDLPIGLRHGNTAQDSRITLIDTLDMFERLAAEGQHDAIESCIRLGHSLLAASGFCEALMPIEPQVVNLMNLSRRD